jgi:hypothetical protein
MIVAIGLVQGVAGCVTPRDTLPDAAGGGGAGRGAGVSDGASPADHGTSGIGGAAGIGGADGVGGSAGMGTLGGIGGVGGPGGASAAGIGGVGGAVAPGESPDASDSPGDAHDALADTTDTKDAPAILPDASADIADAPVSQPDAPVSPPDAPGGADAPGGPPDAPRDGFEAPPPTLKSPGASCGGRGECQSANCVEGVCCDHPCDTACSSCLNANTGKPTGQCAPVKAGVAHGSDCTATDPTTCGLDGKCDGAGACRQHGSSTVCRGEACLPGTTNYSPTSVCDGKGMCVPMSQSCGKFKCAADGVRCRSSCGADTDCSSASYCDAPFCLDRLSPKSVCSRSEQCTSGLCGGRCCNVGAPCKCTQPNPNNLFANAGFDTNIDGWTFGSDSEIVSWTSADAENCPFSGSILSRGNSGSPGRFVTLTVGTQYHFGAKFSPTVAGAAYLCYFIATGGDASISGNLNIIGQWTSDETTFMAMATEVVQVECEVMDVLVDQMYLTPVPGRF